MADNARKEPERLQLHMVRLGLAELPELDPPDGYHVRTFQQGDRDHWLRIVGAAFEDPSWDESRFTASIVDHAGFAEDRLFLVCAPDGRPCATAGAFRTDDPGVGYLHYVAVHPTAQGRGLGYLVSLAAIRRFRQDGLACAMLETDDHRLPAIATYLRLGFSPLLRPGPEDAQTDRWSRVLQELGRPHR